MSSAAEKKQSYSRSNVASDSNMHSEADTAKFKQVAPARTGADASQAVDHRRGIDADDEDATSTERWMRSLVIGESPPGYYQ